jgi:hypothetical protein
VTDGPLVGGTVVGEVTAVAVGALGLTVAVAIVVDSRVVQAPRAKAAVTRMDTARGTSRRIEAEAEASGDSYHGADIDHRI